MAYSFVNFGSKSPGDNITVPFPFQSREEVAVRVNGTLVATDKYSWVNNGLLLCLTGFPSGPGEVRRSTLSEDARVSLTGTATLDYPGINRQTDQLLFIGQEASDRVEDLENRGWVTSDQDDGGTITKGDNDVLIKYDADGNLVPAELTVGNMVQVAAIADDITLVASKTAAIEDVADNLTPIQTVASNIANVNAVGPQVVKVASVADNLGIVEDVADNLADINALAPHATAVGALGGRVAGLDALASRTSELDTLATVSGDLSALGPQAANMALLVPAVGDMADLAPRAGDLEDLGPQAPNLAILGPKVSALEALAPRVGDLEDLGPQAPNLAILGPKVSALEALAPRVGDLEDLGPRAADLQTLGPRATALGLLADRATALDALSTTDRLSVLDSLYPVAGAMSLLGPRHFDLEALAPRVDDLEALGPQAAKIGSLADRAATLDVLEARTTELDALGPRASDLQVLGPRAADLQALAPRVEDLEDLGPRAADLQALAPHAADLGALAGGLQDNIDVVQDQLDAFGIESRLSIVCVMYPDLVVGIMDGAGKLRLLESLSPTLLARVTESTVGDQIDTALAGVDASFGVESRLSIVCDMYPRDVQGILDGGGRLRYVQSLAPALIALGGDIPEDEVVTFVPPTTFYMFLIGGQSNAVGQGAGGTTIEAGITKQWYSSALTDKTGDPIGNANTGSAWPAFANKFFELTGCGVIFVPASVSGAAQCSQADRGSGHWDVGGVHYGASITKLNAAIAAVEADELAWQLGGILWVQGESDAIEITDGNATDAQYYTALDAMLTRFEADTGTDFVPFLMAMTGQEDDGDPSGWSLVRAKQREFVKARANAFLAFTGAKNFAGRGLMKDTYHYFQPAYDEMGEAMAVVAASVCLGQA